MSTEIRNELKQGRRVIYKEYTRPNGKLVIWLTIYREPSKSNLPKPELNFTYNTIEDAESGEKRYFDNIKDRQLRKDEETKKRQTAKETMKNPFFVGQILYDSWGYDQTNIDFYQVTEVKERSILMRPINGKFVDNTSESHGMACNVSPKKDSFIGPPILKIIQFRVWSGKPTAYVKSKHGWISEYNKEDKGVYSSWYA